MSTHPIQPLEIDAKGVLRFKQNKIVNDLLNKATEAKIMDLNTIAMGDYSREDREQFAQLIGYSHSGAHDLGYMSSEVLVAAQAAFDSGTPEAEARAKKLTAAERKFFLQKGAPVPDSIWSGKNSDFLYFSGNGWSLSELGRAVADALKARTNPVHSV